MATDVIYLDNNASTAPDPLVVDAMVDCLLRLYANPASVHQVGIQAGKAVEGAREKIASLLSCPPRAIVFTSGATEANGLAIRGLWTRTRESGRDAIVVGATEHPAVIETATSLIPFGARVLFAPVDTDGVVEIDALRHLVDNRTLLVSVMAANNETGTVAPLRSVINIAKAAGAYVHTDATQLIGRLPLDMTDLDVDLLSLSGHKMYGPKGIGVLAARRHVPLAPEIYGGGHERGLRSGTPNTPGIVGLGVAAELAVGRFHENSRIEQLRDHLHEGLARGLGGVSLNGHKTNRLPNTLNLRFSGADSDAVMTSLGRVACSTGSACSSAVPAPSHVLLAMGLDPEAAGECIRLSLSRTTTVEEIDSAIDEIVAAVAFVRGALG